MEENKSNEIKKAYEKDIENGGHGLVDNQGDVEAVRNEEKSADQIERMMSRDEIFTVVRENGMYMNMLAPCLSANIFLDGRIINYFLTPMKPIDLEEKVSDVMNLVLMEISKEQNGVVFKADGSLDVGESIKQSALNGIPTIPLLKDTMPDGMVSALEQKYFEMYRTGMDAAWGITADNGFEKIDKEHLDRILSLGIKNSRDALEIYNNHDRYHRLFDEKEKTKEEKEQERKKVEANQTEIDKVDKKIIEIKAQLEKYEKGSEEYNKTLIELQRWGTYKGKLHRENLAMVEIDESKIEAIQAKGLVATIKIMQKIGLAPKDYKNITEEAVELNQSSSLARSAGIKEGFTSTVEKNYLTELSKTDIEKLTIFREKAMAGKITEQERNEYLVESLKNYVVYSNIQLKDKNNVIDPELIKANIEQSLEGLVTTIPSVKGIDGKLDWSRIVTAVQELGYEDVNLENITKTFALEKGKEIQEEIAGLVKSAELDFKEHEDREDAEFLDFFKEAEKELELVKYLNYAKRLEEKGLGDSTLRIFKRKLKKEGLENVIERADKMYEESEYYNDEIMDNYKRGHALKKYEEFKKLSKKEIKFLPREEKGAYVSAMIAAYDVSRDETSVSLEMQEAAKDVLETFLGDVFDENGDIDDEKVFKTYKNTFKTGSKYALGKENEDINAFFEFHEKMTLNKVQNKVFSHFMDIASDKERIVIQDDFIKNAEAASAVERKGEELDDSAITNPVQVIANVPPITKKEAEELVEKQGEPMRVDDPKEKAVETKKQVTHSVDKTVEEQGNSKDVRVENMQVGSTALIEKKEKGFFAKAWNFLKEKVSNLFGGNSDSNNSDSNSTTSTSGGVVQENKSEQVVNTPNNNWVQQANIDVKAAQDKANESKGKDDPAIEDDLAK